MNAPLTALLNAVAAETNALAAEGVARLDAQATNSAAARELYKTRVPIYPKLVHGRFRLLKWVGMVVMLGDLLRHAVDPLGSRRAAPRSGGARRSRARALLLLLDRDLAAGSLLHHRAS